MKIFRALLFVIVFVWGASSTSAYVHGQEIKTIKEIKATSVKNQANSGTCWSFATVSFLESELLRTGKGEYNLSEMYIVRMAYLTKAIRYIRLQGNLNFGPGGQAHDAINVLRDYGMVPDEVYSGLNDGDTVINHAEMDAMLHAIVKTAMKSTKDGVFPKWQKAFGAVLDAYLGKVPQEFESKGKKYTALTFAASLGLNPDDYIEITSYSHHPYNKQFVVEVPDNWASGEYYNVKPDELISIVTNAVNNGYTVAWDGDVSDDKGFSSNNGVAKTKNEDQTITTEERQKAFDDFSTTDDHLMQITGIGQDESGKTYFLTKNSWGTTRGNQGYWWLSENYLRLKTIAIMINKNALPADMAKKLSVGIGH